MVFFLICAFYLCTCCYLYINVPLFNIFCGPPYMFLLLYLIKNITNFGKSTTLSIGLKVPTLNPILNPIIVSNLNNSKFHDRNVNLNSGVYMYNIIMHYTTEVITHTRGGHVCKWTPRRAEVFICITIECMCSLSSLYHSCSLTTIYC